MKMKSYFWMEQTMVIIIKYLAICTQLRNITYFIFNVIQYAWCILSFNKNDKTIDIVVIKVNCNEP